MFTEEQINRAWSEAKSVTGYDPAMFRKDSCGAWIVRNAYANTNSAYGWEIDHVFPKSKGGDDNPQNLRAMQWENNRSKGDDYPTYMAKVQAQENKNVYVEIQREVNKNLQEVLERIYNI